MSPHSGGRTSKPLERASTRFIVQSVLRTLGAVAVLVTTYYLLPLEHASALGIAAVLAGGLVLLALLLTYQVRSVMFSPHPAVSAVESIAISVPLILLLFAAAYTALSTLSAGSFGEPMTHSKSLYFTVTVFSTVGFGDITPKTDGARLVVTGQMVVDIVIIGFVIKAMSYAVKVRHAKG